MAILLSTNSQFTWRVANASEPLATWQVQVIVYFDQLYTHCLVLVGSRVCLYKLTAFYTIKQK